MLAAHALDISAGKMSGLWPGEPAGIKLDGLNVLCAVPGCGVDGLLIPEPGKWFQGRAAAPSSGEFWPQSAILLALITDGFWPHLLV